MTVKLDMREVAAALPEEAGDDGDLMDKELGKPYIPG